ncbi:SDR family oxidoreductase [Streptomyces sp. HUCO-GS316]|uniref:SDR family NAD(P)-dependent oxidoreductase n=1 Tax=Streptomyces sp. HUCO-GS316 TaxID=2692198 RepID=UPI00136942BE|nr:SDR family NAD(P)-dependent oxidoreductase [Streptomyces sp. HUCO-GS316]MXM65360.1 SDR family oxidoreductase [Streptomyces sp. HUCO-GS316]
MNVTLTGKHALVTGGSRGIGRAIVLALARAGADVLACHQNPSAQADQLAAELKRTDGDHHLLQADVTDPVDVDRLVEEARTRYGSLDVVVHNAGVISHVPLPELRAAEWHRVLDTSLTAAFTVLQKTLPLYGKGASVVLIGSRAAARGIPLRAHYTAAKAGLEGFARSAAKELGGRGVRVNVIAPGVIDSDDIKAIPADRRAELVARYSEKTAIGRLGETEEVAGAAVFLASDLSSYVTGQTLNVDGGI